MNDRNLNRRGFMGLAAGGTAVAAGALSVPAIAQSTAATSGEAASGIGGALPMANMGAQIFTVRDLLDEGFYGVVDTMELLADAGVSRVEIGGNYYGRTPAEFREVVEGAGLTVASNHFGPRSMSEDNPWYSETGREDYFAQARELGFNLAGTGHYYNVPLTVEGFTQFARDMNVFGEAASKHGMKYFFHNHNGEFTRFDNKPIYHILLEETDPDLVAFELDIGWAAIAGEDVVELVREHQHRFPYFHVKDFVWRDDGVRETRDGTLAAGKRFDFANVGKGVIDWAAIFGTLEDPSAHTYFVEHDDAGVTQLRPEDGDRRPANPPGSANTIWSSIKYLSELEF